MRAKLKCVDCGKIDEGGTHHVRQAKMHLAVYCAGCKRSTPHNIIPEDSPADAAMDVHSGDQQLNEHVELHHGDEGVMYPTGCEDCVIATFHDDDRDVPRAIVSLERLQAHFEEEFKDDEDPVLAAQEWIGFNVIGAYMGPGTPMYVNEVNRD